MRVDPLESPLRRALLQVSLVLLPLAAFAPGLTSPLTHYDDPLYLDRFEHFPRGLAGWSLLWSGAETWRGAFLEFFPLRDSVYWLIFQQWEKWPLPYHLVSLACHLLATQLVFRLVTRLGQPLWVAGTTALLFAVHPVHLEAVVWVAGLKDPLYTCFFLGSLLLYCDYRERQRPGQYAAALLLLVGALLVKSMALSTPLVMLALERWVGRPTPWRAIVYRLAGPGLVCALFLSQFLLIGRLNNILSSPHQHQWAAHWVLTAWAQVGYLRQAFFPASFRLIYCFEPVTSLLDLRLLAGLAVLGAVGFLLWRWRAVPLRLFCIGFYFACLLPVSNLIPFPAVMADRYLYAASIGVCLLMALLLEETRPRLKNTVVIAVVATLTLTTALHSASWQDEESLWQEADEDPTCLADPEFPAAQTHWVRYRSTHSDATRILALERLLASPGLKDENFGRQCDAWLNGAPLLEAAGEHPKAKQWADRAVASCGWHRKLWPTVLRVTVHRDLPAAARAAAKWSYTEPTPATRLFRVLTQLELTDTPASREELEALVLSAPAATCPALRLWLGELRPRARPALEGAARACDP